ncbi:MAG: SCO family protein [Bacteroidota bacterium]
MLLLALLACDSNTVVDQPGIVSNISTNPSQELRFYGNPSINGSDTANYQIPSFSFLDQDSQIITNSTFSDKVYVVDFFFTSCPTICPKVKQQMLRLYEKFEGNQEVAFLSHSIDTRHDSVPVLKDYANKMEVSSDRWHFVTGNKDDIYEMADAYFIVAKEDPTAPGGFDHSGRLILIDKNRHVRAHCNGTDPEDVDRMMADINLLLNEK